MWPYPMTRLDARIFGQMLLKLVIPKGLIILTNTISCCFCIFAFLKVTTVFTENVYFGSFKSSLFFERELMIHMLFLFPIYAFVTRGTMKSPSEDFLQRHPVLSVVCLFLLFLFMSSAAYEIVPFDLSIVVQETEIVQMPFFDVCSCNVTKLS